MCVTLHLSFSDRLRSSRLWCGTHLYTAFRSCSAQKKAEGTLSVCLRVFFAPTQLPLKICSISHNIHNDAGYCSPFCRRCHAVYCIAYVLCVNFIYLLLSAVRFIAFYRFLFVFCVDGSVRTCVIFNLFMFQRKWIKFDFDVAIAKCDDLQYSNNFGWATDWVDY